jgi:hypothetical protein
MECNYGTVCSADECPETGQQQKIELQNEKLHQLLQSSQK